jgi:hypothetical protein
VDPIGTEKNHDLFDGMFNVLNETFEMRDYCYLGLCTTLNMKMYGYFLMDYTKE